MKNDCCSQKQLEGEEEEGSLQTVGAQSGPDADTDNLQGQQEQHDDMAAEFSMETADVAPSVEFDDRLEEGSSVEEETASMVRPVHINTEMSDMPDGIAEQDDVAGDYEVADAELLHSSQSQCLDFQQRDCQDQKQ